MEAGNPSKPSTSQNSNKLVEEVHNAPSLVGRIVEKGFSPSGEPQKNPSHVSFPRPSVLPFPVARHRSHGPHWSPAVTRPNTGGNGNEVDKDDADYEPVSSSFANPVERREKKGLDLSRWRELVSADGSAVSKPKKKESKLTAAGEGKRKALPVTGKPVPNGADNVVAENHARLKKMLPEAELMEKMDPAMPAVPKKRGQDKIGSKESEQEIYDGVGSQCLMDDIDVENLARLKQMSPEELAEAQAEIMEKFDPAKLDMLRKRGLDKLGSKKGPASNKYNWRQESRVSGPIEDGKRPKMSASPRDMLLPSEPNGSLWKTWSERVEKVRTMRFSLEGNILETNSTQEHPNGDDPLLVQYSIENVAERDYLRTEGDPAAVGYTIKEAVALTRSLVPGQRTLALQLLASVFNKTLHNLQKKDAGYIRENTNHGDKLIDWQAVWAFALGPEPELALSLRIALDDNHDSVVLACGKVIRCVLSCDINENFFDLKEKVPTHDKNICTAPVFRSRPEVDGGFLHGGFWKYNTKPSNILPSDTEDEENEGKHTIQDDIVVAGQDVAAGLVRMGILPRICYLLEMDPLPKLEDCVVSVLVALARHSPICANAIMRCPRLIQTVAKIFTKQDTLEIYPSQIKAVLLLKVLAQSSKQICFDFVKRGFFQGAMWHWYRKTFTLEQWVNSGREHCKRTSAMFVEQLRLWKVCIRYGYCITCFADFFPAMCLWLSRPTFETLIENDILCEFAYVAREAYLVLEALAQRLPNLHSIKQLNKQVKDFSDDSMEAWSWSHVVPMVDLAINWLSLKNILYISSFIGCQNGITNDAQDSSLNCMLWVISAVLHMLSSVFDRIPPCDSSSHLPWLPQFVPKVGLEIVRIGFPSFSDLERKPEDFPAECGSLVEGLCCLRHQNDSESSLSSTSLLHGLIRLALSVDSCVQRARNANSAGSAREYRPETVGEILEEGIIKWAQDDLLRVLSVFTTLVSSEWHVMQSFEMYGRGGPAPGIGVGWGSSGGGFWSLNSLLAQVDAELILGLLEITHKVLENDLAFNEGMKPAIEGSAGAMALTTQRINSVLAVCLIAGPGDRALLEKAFNILLQPSVLKYLSFCYKGFRSFDWQYNEEDYLFFSKILNTHFRDRWLSIKQKSPGKSDRDNYTRGMSQNSDALETIHEDLEIPEMTCGYPDQNSLVAEWAHQRLPLPVHWFLSAICNIGNTTSTSKHSSSDILDVAKSGLFFLLGLEALSSLPCSGSQDSPISAVPLVWKLHALSVALHVSVDVLEEKTRDVFETLQELYGQHLDKLRCRITDPSRSLSNLMEARENGNLETLNFQTQVHESYSTFIENIIEQFGALSYGDISYGRQIALYLHRSVEASVRLVAWTVLSNAHVHHLLPPLDKCIAEAEGYLVPAEHNEQILEAYAKSWISGGLDKAAARGSVSFTLALCHLSCFIFSPSASDKLSLRNKLAKSLLHSYSQKTHQQGMLLDLVRYSLPVTQELQHADIERRFEILKQACDGNYSLLAIVEKLRLPV